MTSDGLGEMFKGDFADMCIVRQQISSHIDEGTIDSDKHTLKVAKRTPLTQLGIFVTVF